MSNGLPVKKSLTKRGVLINTLFPHCNEKDDDIDNVNFYQFPFGGLNHNDTVNIHYSILY